MQVPYVHQYYPSQQHSMFTRNRRAAYAKVKGGPLAPQITGMVVFLEVPNGTEVFAEIYGLPQFKQGREGMKPIGPHAFHIHEKGSCDVGKITDPFKGAGGHWNPDQQPHGNHAGDFPVLFSNSGYARMSFFTNRFTAEDVIGKTVIIHQNPDDYQSQPAGDAGLRLACGKIKGYTQTP